jgi:hypothetical protein
METERESTGQNPDDLLDTREAAAVLRLSPGTLQNQRVSGCGPRYIKLGQSPKARVRYRRGDLMKWLSQHARQSTTQGG